MTSVACCILWLLSLKWWMGATGPNFVVSIGHGSVHITGPGIYRDHLNDFYGRFGVNRALCEPFGTFLIEGKSYVNFGALTVAWQVAFPLLLPLVLSSVVTALLYRRVRRIRPGHCSTCGYNLTGNESGICSECGTKIGEAKVGENGGG